MAQKMMIEAAAFAVIGPVIEKMFLVKSFPYLYESSAVIPALPHAYGFVVAILTGYSFWMTMFGMKVGQARSKYRALAEAAGETDLERYNYPNLYVFGTSDNARAVNNAQRAHQHVLECIAQMFFATLIASTAFPLTTALSTFLWTWGRMEWSNAYLEHGAEKRYTHFLSTWIWKGLIINFMLAMLPV
jgi:hypothetical protein